MGSYFPHSSLECADLQRLISSGRASLQLPEDIATAPFRIGLEPREDLLPFSLKGVLVGAPPAQHPFSPLLLVVQGLEPCFRSGDTPLLRLLTRYTLFYRKDVERGG